MKKGITLKALIPQLIGVLGKKDNCSKTSSFFCIEYKTTLKHLVRVTMRKIMIIHTLMMNLWYYFLVFNSRRDIINKKMFFFTSIFIGMIVLLYLMTNTFWEVRQAVEKVYRPQIPLMKMSLWGFLFGILIEWKTLKSIIKGNIKINWLLIPAIILIIACFIPSLYWSVWFGNGAPFYIQMFSMADCNVPFCQDTKIKMLR